MSKRRVFVRPVSKTSKYQPAIRVAFTGAAQNDYFALKRIAEEDFEITQAELSRLILCDFVRSWKALRENGPKAAAEQIEMRLKGMKEYRPKKESE